MSGKFFVGRPGRKSRETILRAVEEHKVTISFLKYCSFSVLSQIRDKTRENER
jgi:hypothetical protein